MKIQAWLRDAEHMTVDQIIKLAIKPDVKKAMLFVRELGHVSRSTHTAELLADLMNTQHTVHTPQLAELWQYDGESFPIKCKSRNWISLTTPFVFLKKQDQAFVGHNWVNLHEDQNHLLTLVGRQIGMGDHIMYNQKTQELIQKRHHT